MATKLTLNRDWKQILARTTKIPEALEDRAEAIAAEARRIAPRRTGAYADGIRVDSGRERGYPLSRVNATHFTSWWVEAGTVRTPPFAPLRRAVESESSRQRLR